MKSQNTHPRWLLVVVMLVGTTLLLACSGRTEAATYDISQLKKMVKLLRALRVQVDRKLQQFTTRTNTVTQEVATSQANANAEKQNIASAISGTALNQTASVLSSLHIIPTYATKGGVEGPGTSVTLSNPLIQRGMLHVGSKTTVSRAGTYVLHLNIRTDIYESIYIDVYVRDENNNIKQHHILYMDWEVAPFYFFLLLEPGDSVSVGQLGFVRSETEGTHMSLHYIGYFDQSAVPNGLWGPAIPLPSTTPYY